MKHCLILATDKVLVLYLGPVKIIKSISVIPTLNFRVFNWGLVTHVCRWNKVHLNIHLLMYYLLAQYIFNYIWITHCSFQHSTDLPIAKASVQWSEFHIPCWFTQWSIRCGAQEESRERHRKTKSVLPVGRGPGEVLVKRQKAGVRGKLRPQPLLGQKCHYFFRYLFCPPVSTLQLNVHWSSPLSPLCPVLCGLCLSYFFSSFLRMFSTDLHTSSLILSFPLILSIQSVELYFQLLHLTVLKCQFFQ